MARRGSGGLLSAEARGSLRSVGPVEAVAAARSVWFGYAEAGGPAPVVLVCDVAVVSGVLAVRGGAGAR